MKKLLIVVFALMLFAVPVALASDWDFDGEYQFGLGLDLTVYESNSAWLEEINTELRYNSETEDTNVFIVGKINVWDLVSGNTE